MTGESVPFPLPVSRLGAKSREANALYQELRKPLLRYLVCLGISADEAQDVVQDAFVSLQRHLASEGSQENIRSWLFRVAHNRARNRQKSYERRFRAPLDSEIEAIPDQASPERAVLEKEKFQRLGNAIRSLSDAERECLLLRAGGLRYREIGEVLGIPTSSVGDTVERAVRKLAEKCDV
jgi:RNA polymerase sigma-70 factor, ECF subfamily